MRADNHATAWTPVHRVNKIKADFGSFQLSTTRREPSTGTIADLHKTPMPTAREIVQYEYTTYVELQRSKNTARGQGMTLTAFIKNMLALIQSVDKMAAILGYEDPSINSICHPSHVPFDQEEFVKYFPRAYTNQGRMTVKCKMT